jgi:hypothetical protein
LFDLYRVFKKNLQGIYKGGGNFLAEQTKRRELKAGWINKNPRATKGRT